MGLKILNTIKMFGLRVFMKMFACAKVFKNLKEVVDFYMDTKEPNKTPEKNVKYKLKKTLAEADT